MLFLLQDEIIFLQTNYNSSYPENNTNLQVEWCILYGLHHESLKSAIKLPKAHKSQQLCNSIKCMQSQ